jgi:hypothetical protein
MHPVPEWNRDRNEGPKRHNPRSVNNRVEHNKVRHGARNANPSKEKVKNMTINKADIGLPARSLQK